VAPQVGSQLGSGQVLLGTVPEDAQVGGVKIPACKTLRLILGDQLDIHHSWFRQTESDVLYVLAELHQEATYVRHHVQKVAAFFLSMQAFARLLQDQGHQVLYLDLDETARFSDLPDLLRFLLETSKAERFEYQRPDEYRLMAQLEAFGAELDRPCQRVESEHFLLPYEDIERTFSPGRAHRMETFYRSMRKRLGILMEAGGTPLGGRWNFDAENRKKLPAAESLPPERRCANPSASVYRRIRRHHLPVIGKESGETLDWPVNREQSLDLLRHFLEHALPRFGRYQDAMSDRDWLLFHSRLSFSMNTKMLSPREVVEAATAEAEKRPDAIPLSSLEGFVRQIIGWREFMRGMYWANMPAYAEANHLGHERGLPHFFWDGKTKMACMAHAIGQSLDHAYAHHIQRLMVTGNFALLAGIDPDAVDAWYLGIYIDAIEWVEMPNTRGMSQFADGGLVASKPYCSSGNYINKMSDYCSGCHYRVAQKTGPAACPFNSLYWHFMDRNRERLSSNPRIGMAYRTWDRMDPGAREEILATAKTVLATIDSL
jgi:deoxyribodipyrimidine photolyase-related protein